MRIVRRSRRLSSQTIPDPLDQCLPGGFDYVDIPNPATEPLAGYPVPTTASYESPLSPQAIEYLSAFADQRELAPPDLHSQCHRRKGKNGNAPRPPNAFMLFRSDFWKFNKETIPERDHRQISRIAAHCWNVLAEPRRAPYQKYAKQLKDEHAQLYPQHKYNLSGKDRILRKVKREQTDDGELCDVIAARVAQDVRTSKSPKTERTNGSGLLDQVVERKANLKRPRSASAVAVVERTSKGESQFSELPVNKRKKKVHKHSSAAIPVLEVQSQTGPSHSFTPPFVPTNEIPALTLPPSRNSPTVKAEPLQDLVLEAVAHIVALRNEPTLSPPPMAGPSKSGSSEFEVPEPPASVSQQSLPFGYKFPIQYTPPPTDSVVDKGLQFSADYGLSGPTEGLDFSLFGYGLGDASATGLVDEQNESDEFAKWCHDFS
ncbi:hypothetical protein BDM02DRAFT_3125171 [Thelephora ganbajun]|uniref:Uncharacterized protein n=1 Tax=Thelephora ganbajun TaxID=370292 RepID=A0ACB6ZWU6_THEGA|nr:hypothetical protein BDM02DRAFT_3125171 [Thelephora ganbajun]